MLDLIEVPIGTDFYIYFPSLGCVAMRLTDRTGTDLIVEYVGDITRASRKPLLITQDLCERSFLDRDECIAYTTKLKLAKMYQGVERARDDYLKIKSQAEKAISKVLEQNADLISKFPEMFL